MPTQPSLAAAEQTRLETEASRLLDFARASGHPDGGFGWLDEAGRVDAGRGVQAWITGRMTHCFALAQARGDASAAEYVDRGVHALRTLLHDDRHGGWHSTVSADGPSGNIKEGYAHAFVVLAASSAAAVGHPDGAALLDEALDVLGTRFWSEEHGLIADAWNADWTELEPYRGVNANMHALEALLAAADVTGEEEWRARALRISKRVVHGFAREHDWRLPEHFDESWRVQLDYNIDEPGHPFRPYGVTIGHLFEWARLVVHLHESLGAAAPGWLLPDARSLYDAAAGRGWAVDGADGFVYTTDFADRPVIRERMHWVAAEAIAAAWTLERVTAEGRYLDDFGTWWEYAERYLVDHEGGSWHHELDPANRPSATVWQGKPDVYHAYQAVLLPLLPPAGSFIGAVTSR